MALAMAIPMAACTYTHAYKLIFYMQMTSCQPVSRELNVACYGMYVYGVLWYRGMVLLYVHPGLICIGEVFACFTCCEV